MIGVNIMSDLYKPLGEGEFHPVSTEALNYIKRKKRCELVAWLEAFNSSALSGDISAMHCGQTLDLIMRGEGVGERYVLALAFVMQQGER